MIRNTGSRTARRMRGITSLCGTLCLTGVAVGGGFGHFPGAPIDQRTQRVQEQVETLYNERDYERARLIYEKELAPAGDKYAQYMVGYMLLTGRGAAEDPSAALAWYRLASERNDNPFVQARDALAATLHADAIRRADDLYLDLWQRLGDRRLLLELLQRDLDALDRLGEFDGAQRVANGALASGFLGRRSRANIEQHIRERIDTRLQYLESMPSLKATAGSEDSTRLGKLEDSVRRRVTALTPD